jgi:hypothetical protein
VRPSLRVGDPGHHHRPDRRRHARRHRDGDQPIETTWRAHGHLQRVRRLSRPEPRPRPLPRRGRAHGLPQGRPDRRPPGGRLRPELRAAGRRRRAEVVEVVGRAATIQTEKADVSAVVEQKKVVDLPLVGRNPLALATLQPGVVGIPGTTDFLAAEQGMGINAPASAAAATAPRSTASASTAALGRHRAHRAERRGRAGVPGHRQQPVGRIRPQLGRAVSIITKGGTNNFSGTAFEFHRNQDLAREDHLRDDRSPTSKRTTSARASAARSVATRRSSSCRTRACARPPASGLYTVETEALKNWVVANRPNSIAAHALTQQPAAGVPHDGVARPRQPGARCQRHRSARRHSGRRHDPAHAHAEAEGRAVQRPRGPAVSAINDRLRGTYYISQIESLFLYVRPQFNPALPVPQPALQLELDEDRLEFRR